MSQYKKLHEYSVIALKTCYIIEKLSELFQKTKSEHQGFAVELRVLALLGIIFILASEYNCPQTIPEKSELDSVKKHAGYDLRTALHYLRLGKDADLRGNPRAAIDNLLHSRKIFLAIKETAVTFDNLNPIIAENYKRMGLYDSALVYLQMNFKNDKKNNVKVNQVHDLLSISYFYRKLNDKKKSAECLYNALRIAETLKDHSTLFSVYDRIGDVFSEEKKNYSIARDYYNKALENVKPGELDKGIALLNAKIGRTYLYQDKDSIAMKYALKSLALSKQINYRHSLSDSYLTVAQVYKKLGKDKLAIENFSKAWEIKCDFCPPVTFHMALIGIADIYMKMKDYSRALLWYKKSLELAKSSLAPVETAQSKFRIGDYHSKMNFYPEAEKEYLQSLMLAREINNYSLIKNIADTISTFYLGRNNYKKAVDYLKLSRAMEDSVSKMEQQASMANLEMNFEFEKLQQANETNEIKAREEIKRQNIFLYSFISFSILLGILGTVIFASYRRKNNDNILLTIRKEQIEQKNSEIQLRIDEITKQKNEIEKISEQLHQADQAKLRFFTNISHELRTPLTLILSPLMKFIKYSSDEENKGLYSLMFRNARKLQEMIDSLLDISKIDKGELKLSCRMNDLNKLTHVIASMFQSVSEEKKIKFDLIEKDNNIKFCFDAERVEQIINNLLSNAFKFTPDHGAISIELDTYSENNPLSGKIADFAKIVVRDNGIGISPEYVEKVFDRFYQCDSTIQKNIPGSGIGLALTRELVLLHNGTINVNSKPGEWTEFSVLLPLVNANTEQPVENEYFSQKDIAEPDYHRGNVHLPAKFTETVLIAEDNADLRFYLEQCLCKHFNVLLADNGADGIQKAVQCVPDIIISDVMMPEKDGYQLTNELKNNIHTSHVPIILLTARAARESKMEGLGMGADDYIVKPFDEEELILKIKNILSTRQKLQRKYRQQMLTVPSEVTCMSLDEQFLISITQSVEQEICNRHMDVEFICKKMGTSRAQLYRKLKALTGLTINQFIRSIRLKRAAQLIEKKTATISEIAYTTGFDNLSYFTKKFKEEFGKLPSEY